MIPLCMHLSEIRDYCLSLPGVTEDIKWEHHLCFSVGEKMFLITSPDEVPVNASFKVTEDEFAALCSRDGFRPASHLARYHWIGVNDISTLGTAEWKRFISQSYRLVAEKLPASLRAKLGITKG